MGIFTDLALGGVTQFGEVAERDTQANITIANNSLSKENEAVKKTELAQKNFQEIKNIVKNNPSYFNIVPTGNFTLDQMVDMYV
jgi:ureidoglycolate hydrolase